MEWEYLAGHEVNLGELIAALDNHGNNGWELVSFLKEKITKVKTEVYTYVMKRRKDNV
jgi:hypothetical protein